MQINVVLPLKRVRPGQFSVADDSGSVVFGPVPSLGKADNAASRLFSISMYAFLQK